MNALDQLRLKASYGTTALLWLNVLFSGLAGWLHPAAFSIWTLAASGVIAGLSTAVWSSDKAGPTTRVVHSMALAAQVGLLVYLFSGAAYQIDMHMYFFATLAICAVWIDWRAIVAYAGLVAVHHLALYVAMP
ncbi:MAG: chemotaxis protein, partial [Hyphomicrobiales bacterium]